METELIAVMYKSSSTLGWNELKEVKIWMERKNNAAVEEGCIGKVVKKISR